MIKNENETQEINDKNINLNEEKNNEPEMLHEINIAYARSGLENTFTSFLYNDIPYLVFATKEKSLMSYNLNHLSINSEVKNAHEDYISKVKSYQK